MTPTETAATFRSQVHRRLRWFLLAAAVLAVSCSGSQPRYEPPTTIAAGKSVRIPGSDADIFKAAIRVFVTEGFQIAFADEDIGAISTVLRHLPVAPQQADCGRLHNTDPLTLDITDTRVGFTVFIDNGTLKVRAVIEHAYKPEGASLGVTYTCESRGMLEDQLIEKIKSAMPSAAPQRPKRESLETDTDTDTEMYEEWNE